MKYPLCLKAFHSKKYEYIVQKVCKKIEKDPTLTNLIKRNKLNFIAQSCEVGYENYFLYRYFGDSELYVLLRYNEDGGFEFISFVNYETVLWLPLIMSKDLIELREYIYLDDTLDNIPSGTYMKCLGHCSDYYRLWLFQYKDSYVLLEDRGNGHYSFYKEVTDLSTVPIVY